jgi:hypothetical protein
VPFGGIMPCRDGFLQFTFHEEHQWRSLVKYMGDPDWAHRKWVLIGLTGRPEVNSDRRRVERVRDAHVTRDLANDHVDRCGMRGGHHT